MTNKPILAHSKQQLYLLDARSATDHFPGIGRYVSNLAQALVPLLTDDEHLLILRDPERPSQWQLPQQSEKATLLNTAVSPFGLNQQWHIPKLLQNHKIAVYHSPYYIMPYRLNIPTVLTLYDLIPQKYPQTVSLKARLMATTLTKMAMRRATHMIAISEATRQDFLAEYALDAQSITAVPLAVDAKFSPQSETTIQTIRDKYNLPSKYVLYLGINKPHKNLVRLIQAWQIVQEKIAPKQTLVIAGAWDDRYPEVKQLIATRNLSSIVLIAGPIADADLPALYSGADLFVFPSIYEGFGLPVLEAMACGTAVTCSNTSSLPEVGGDAVLYFDPTNITEIAQQLITLLQQPALITDYANKGLQQAEKFMWTDTAVATLQIYRSLSG